MTSAKSISIIIPARNEAACIRRTLTSVLESAAFLQASGSPAPALVGALGTRETRPARGARGDSNTPAGTQEPNLAESAVEILVVDNQSTDATGSIVREYERSNGVAWIPCPELGAARARNWGARLAKGSIYVFVDADTRIPPAGLHRISSLVNRLSYWAGIFPLRGDTDTRSSRCWWTFWNMVRRLPLPRAKALPAFMFCTREAFNRFGPFDESVQIGEEWPILAGVYRFRPGRFIYDHSLTATTSDRRMTLQRHGYARILFKYIWAVLHRSGRNGYPDTFRE